MGEHAAEQPALVGLIMGSQSDWPTLRHAADMLDQLAVPHEARVVSAHRTPDRLAAYAKTARGRGLRVIIAGAGGAAHLPGMCAAWTALPVLGVPTGAAHLQGLGQPAFDRADAGRRSGRHVRNRPRRRGERGAARRRDPRPR